MKPRIFLDLGIVALTGFAAVAPAQNAAAQSCDTDADCAHGYACQVTGGGGSCSAPACDDGVDCPEPECETFEYRECVPGACAGDNDCAEGMVCHTSSYETCTGGGASCDSSEDDCPPPEPAECQQVSESRCTARYELPCVVDADCGGGFRCTEQTWVECSGGSSGGTNGGGDDAAQDAGVAQPKPGVDEPDAVECTEVQSGTFYCELLVVPCEADAECPSGLTCQDNDVVCSYPDVPEGEEDSEGAGECAVPAGQPLHVCRPPYYSGGDGTGGTGGTPDNGGPTQDGGAGEPQDAGTDQGGGNAGGTSGAGGSTSNGTPPQGNGTGGSDGEEGDDSDHHAGHGKLARWLAALFGGAGCSVAGSTPQQAGGNLSLLLGVGLALVAVRRRR